MKTDNHAQRILWETLKSGLQKSTEALEKMLKSPVMPSELRVKDVPVEEISSLVRSSDVSTIIALKLTGPAPGLFLLIMDPKDAEKLGTALIGDGKSDVRSALTETGNILSGALGTAMSNQLGLSFIQSVPDSETDITAALIESLVIETAADSDSTLTGLMGLRMESSQASITSMILFSPDAAKKITEAASK